MLEKLPSLQLITFLYEYTTTPLAPVSQHLPARRLAYVAASACATPRLCRSICLRDAPPVSRYLPAQRPVYTAIPFLGIVDITITTTRVVSENPDIVRTARGRIESTAYIIILEAIGVNPVSTKYSVQTRSIIRFSLWSFPYKRTCSREYYCTIKPGGRELPKAPLI